MRAPGIITHRSADPLPGPPGGRPAWKSHCAARCRSRPWRRLGETEGHHLWLMKMDCEHGQGSVDAAPLEAVLEAPGRPAGRYPRAAAGEEAGEAQVRPASRTAEVAGFWIRPQRCQFLRRWPAPCSPEHGTIALSPLDRGVPTGPKQSPPASRGGTRASSRAPGLPAALRPPSGSRANRSWSHRLPDRRPARP
jgi:hypothetical protein